MQRSIKLKDLTKEQCDNWLNNNCILKVDCENCPINKTDCNSSDAEDSWINNKDLYSDKFLNQEIELKMPDILDEQEKDYLSFVIKPFKNRIKYIEKITTLSKSYIHIVFKDEDTMTFPNFPYGTLYKNMRDNYRYRLKDLGL